MLVLAVAQAWAQPKIGLTPLAELNPGMEDLSSPLLVDIVHDSVPEVILTDSRGNVKMFAGDTLSLMAANSINPPSPSTAPAVGDFLGRGRFDLAFGTYDGRLVVMEGSSLRLLAEGKVVDSGRTQVDFAPTAVEVELDGVKRDLLVVPSSDGFIRAFKVTPPQTKADLGKIEKVWEVRTSGAIVGSVAVGNVRQTDRQDLVALNANGEMQVIDPASGVALSRPYVVRERQRLFGSPLLAPIIPGKTNDAVVVATEGGDVFALEYTPGETTTFTPFWTVKTNETPLHSPVLVQVPGDTSRRVILVASPNRFTLIDQTGNVQGASRVGTTLFQDTTALAGKTSEVALLPITARLPVPVFGRTRGLVVLENMDELFSNPSGETPKFTELALPENIVRSPAIGAVGEEPRAVVFAVTLSGRLRSFQTDRLMAWSHSRTPWMTTGSTPGRNSVLDTGYARRERERRTAMVAERTKNEENLAAAMAASDWTKALEVASWLREFDPYNAEYADAHFKAMVSKNLIAIASTLAIFLVVFGYLGILVFRFATWKAALSKASALASRGALDESRGLYEKLLPKTSRKELIVPNLAAVYLAQQDYSAVTLDVYRKAHALNPNDQALLHALTRALLLKPTTGDEAMKVYLAALASFPEPALIEYGLGMCHVEKGNLEEAGKRLRAAMRAGLATDPVYSALCDVYLKTKTFTAKALPVFQHEFPKRGEDQTFLEGYLLASIDARQTGPGIESLCHQVLEGNPKFLPAYCHLAAMHLQKSQVGPAIEEIRNALKVEPDNPQAVALLAHCYLIQGRRDEEALQSIRKALAIDPHERELLRVATEIYFERGRFDAEATDIYRRSGEENPGDVTTLKALAQTAILTSDHALTIKAVEALATQGQMNAAYTVQLATAYVRSGLKEPRVEKTLRDALRQEPKNTEFLGALAHVLAAQERQDLEAIPVYEAHLANSQADVPIGRQLTKAYVKAGRYDAALRTASALLTVAPQDEELKRLVALANLHGNKIDEAIAEYERMLARNPNDSDAVVNLALAFAQKARTDDDAGRVYMRAVELAPENEGIPLALVRLCVARNDQLKAIEWYQRAIRVRPGVEQLVLQHAQSLLVEYPDAVRVRWFQCELLVAMNRLREALEQLFIIFESNPTQANNVLSALEKILAKDPNNVLALLQKGRMQIHLGALPQARQALERANQLQGANPEIQKTLVAAYEKILEKGDDPQVRFNLGRLLYVMQEFDRAIGCFQKTAQDYRWEAESTKMLGKCFTAKGMLDLALQEYKKLVVDDEAKDLLYDLAQRYEAKKDLVGAKTVYRQLFAADIDYKDVKTRFEMLSGSTSDPMAFEKTSIVQQMSEAAARRYELLDELGRGAMGIVYRARDKELDEVVALKILPDNLSNNPEAVRRFKIEARNARKLSHPNIVRIHDIGEEMGRKYISMEYVDGSDLKRKVRSGEMTMRDIFHYALQTADALAYAHRLGIVHRDIKPANIMLTSRNDVKITDFGIAKLMDSGGEGTMVGAVIGTPLYMSPEQVQGIPVDNRADLYAFGVMLYEFVAGRCPFTEGDLAYQHIHKEPPPIEGCPDPLWQVIKKCLAKKREDRWESGEMIYDRLRSIRDQVPGAT